MTHQVSTDDFIGCILSTTLCSSYGKNTGNKELNSYCEIPNGDIYYQVKSFDKVTYVGLSLENAVDVYNKVESK